MDVISKTTLSFAPALVSLELVLVIVYVSFHVAVMVVKSQIKVNYAQSFYIFSNVITGLSQCFFSLIQLFYVSHLPNKK